MLSRTMAGVVCLLVMLGSACAPKMTQLPITTPQFTPEVKTPTVTSAAYAPSATATPLPTRIPTDAIDVDNLGRVRLLHQYWLVVATAAGVDPYEMDISSVAFNRDGSLMAVGGCSKPLEADLRSANVYCSGNDTQSSGGIPFLLILDADAENVIATIPENTPDTTIADLVFTPDGQKLIYAVNPGKFAVWDVASGRVEETLWEGDTADTSAPSIAVSPDGKWIALKPANQAEIWDTVNREFVAEIPADFRPQFSTDSQRILVYHDMQLVVHETGTWEEIVRFGIPCECTYTLSPDFSLLATSEQGDSETDSAPIVIWDVSTGKQTQSLQGGKGPTAFLVFTPDGQMLWRAGERGDMIAWDTQNWQLLAENIGGITPISNLRRFQFIDDGRHYLLLSDLLLGLYGLP